MTCSGGRLTEAPTIVHGSPMAIVPASNPASVPPDPAAITTSAGSCELIGKLPRCEVETDRNRVGWRRPAA